MRPRDGLTGLPNRFISSRTSRISERRCASVRFKLRLLAGAKNRVLRARIKTPLCWILRLKRRSRLSNDSLSLRFTSTKKIHLFPKDSETKTSTYLNVIVIILHLFGVVKLPKLSASALVLPSTARQYSAHR